MLITHLSLNKFAGYYYLFSKLRGRSPEISLAAIDMCPHCGHPYIAIQPVGYINSLLEALQANIHRFKHVIDCGNLDPGVYVCDQRQAFCSGCGEEIHLPIAEVLDADRTTYGRYAMEMNRNLKTSN
jgi:hypothetical protein